MSNIAETTQFYHNISAILAFAEATDARLHQEVPSDWWVVIADIVGSTKAIEAGDYKKVNTVGVACIAAVINVNKSIDLPFIFGGDGATFAVPNAIREDVIKALRAAQQLSRDSFGLHLRVGLVQVANLQKDGFWVRIGKVKLSQHVAQPVLSGRGWEEAERRVKSDETLDVLRVIENEGVADGSFEGFECRWQNVPSFQEHKLALLVAATASDAGTNLATYQRVLDKIQTIYGDVAQYHPLHADKMQLTFNPRQLGHEWRVRSAHLDVFKRVKYFANLLFLSAAGRYIFAKNIDTNAVKWSSYRNDLVENSDFRKFDGMLRMVIDGKNAQADALEYFLQSEHQAGRLAYGTHKSSEALLTCIVQSYNGNHMHFVDGSDGGYALAARQLKQQLKSTLAHQ